MPAFPSPPPTSDPPAVRLQRALQLAQSDRLPEAIGFLRSLLVDVPGLIPARCILAMLLQDSGEGQAALIEIGQAAALAPHDATTHEIRASVLLALGRAADAEAAARLALVSEPRRVRAMEYLGLALDAQERVEETIEALQSSLALQPASALARQVLARRLLQTKKAAAALAVVLHSSLLEDEGRAQQAASDFIAVGAKPQAFELLQALVRHHPRSYPSLILLARTLHQSGRSSEALVWSERAHALRPQELEPLEMHAVSLIERGEVEAGLARFRSLLSREDVTAETRNRHLILAHYDPDENNETLFHAHSDWVRRHIHPFGAPFVRTPFAGAVSPDRDRPLRIGWLSPRFGEGPVASFFTDTLAALDREQFRHVLIPLATGTDAAAIRMQRLADEWLPMHGLADAELLQRLRDLQLDIAIDLAGHSFGNRLGVLAQRIAPIQWCWLDYFDTTAAPSMDGWISDPWLTPEGSSQRYSERLLHLPGGRFCYSPPPLAPPPDRIGEGPVVFVSFNRLAKLNDGVVDAWAQILRRVPRSQLELGAGLLGDAIARARTVERFATRGIASERLRLHATRTYAELLAAYRHTDIALDPFPFSGCTTTCDALWMGLPVVTLPGTTFVSRQSASLLWRLDRSDWIASDHADYIDKAVALAAQVGASRAGRKDLRELTRTHLCDSARQASEFALLMRRLWGEHCERA
jgi:protein O-GlcNAc transferase